jgi:hypothetical protein
VAAAAAALAIAFAVPPARSAILRFLDIGAVRIELVQTLPAAEEASLGSSVGEPIDRGTARLVLGRPFQLPPAARPRRLYQLDGIVSAVLAAPNPVVLSELRDDGTVLKKIASLSTSIEPVAITPSLDGLWISGAPHVVIFPEGAPRLTGNVLLWSHGRITYRLEGRGLERDHAIAIARELSAA